MQLRAGPILPLLDMPSHIFNSLLTKRIAETNDIPRRLSGRRSQPCTGGHDIDEAIKKYSIGGSVDYTGCLRSVRSDSSSFSRFDNKDFFFYKLGIWSFSPPLTQYSGVLLSHLIQLRQTLEACHPLPRTSISPARIILFFVPDRIFENWA